MADDRRTALVSVSDQEDILSWKRRRLDTKSLVNDLMREDALAVVLRGHLYVETLLDDLIGVLLPRARLVEKARLDYGRKIAIALASGVLLVGQEKPLAELNALRNRFAHRLGRKLTRGDVDRLYGLVTDAWWRGILKREPGASEMDQLRSFVSGVVVGLDSKLERIAALRPKVLRLHMSVLRAYAAGWRKPAG